MDLGKMKRSNIQDQVKASSYLFCWDFDNTIVKGHFYNFLCERGIEKGETTPDLINEFLDNTSNGLKHPDKLLQSFRIALQNK